MSSDRWLLTGRSHRLLVFFFNDTATTEIYTLSLHDALPICSLPNPERLIPLMNSGDTPCTFKDRKSTRLNSSHHRISYAVFCLKKKTHDLRTDPASGHDWCASGTPPVSVTV